jgi:integrase
LDKNLTKLPERDKNSPSIPKEVLQMMELIGCAVEYRQGSFRVTISYKGERLDIYRNEHGKRFNCLRDAQECLIYINGLIKAKKFYASEWRANQAFSINKAIEVWLELSDCCPEWLAKKKKIAEAFFKPFFSEQNIFDVREIDSMHIKIFQAFLKGKGFSDKYRYNIMNVLKEFIRFHRASIPKMPEFPTIAVQRPPIRWLTEKQQDEVFSFISEADKPIFTFMRYTGCRPNEAGGLLRENVFLNQEPPYFVLATVLRPDGTVKTNTKTKIAKPLPVIPELVDALRPREATKFVFSKKGTPYTHHRLRHIWEHASLKANKTYGTPVVSLYQGLKHSFGCQRINQGFTIHQIKEVFGHTDIKTTERYAQYATSKLANVMRGNVVHGAKVVQALNEDGNILK